MALAAFHSTSSHTAGDLVWVLEARVPLDCEDTSDVQPRVRNLNLISNSSPAVRVCIRIPTRPAFTAFGYMLRVVICRFGQAGGSPRRRCTLGVFRSVGLLADASLLYVDLAAGWVDFSSIYTLLIAPSLDGEIRGITIMVELPSRTASLSAQTPWSNHSRSKSRYPSTDESAHLSFRASLASFYLLLLGSHHRSATPSHV